MAIVGDLRLVIAVREIKFVPTDPTINRILLIPRDLPKLLDPRLQRVVIATYLTDEQGIKMTEPRLHEVPPGELLSYGPIATDLNVMTL